MFYDIFKQLCEEKGITPTKASAEIGFSKGSVSYWKKRYTEGNDAKPDSYTVTKIADYFGVSVDYLLGRTDNPADYDTNDNTLVEMSLSCVEASKGDMKKAKAIPLSSTFRERLIEAMQLREKTQAELAKATGLSKPRISQYVNGTYEAKQKALYALAEALNVNIAWLMGNDVPMEIDYRKPRQEENFREIIEKACGKGAYATVVKLLKLDATDRALISALLDIMLNQTKYSEAVI